MKKRDYLKASRPLELPMRASNEPVASPASEQAAPASLPSGLQVLLVEDHRDTRMSMEFLLRKSGHQVVSAESAQAALELATKQKFDVVITDLGLPDRSGLELMRDLRDRHGLRGIATSGYGMEEDIAQGRSAGFVHHFTKPISLEKLRRVLADWPEFKSG